MISFQDYLRDAVTRTGTPTEDVLVAFLPLMKQVIAVHCNDTVAPLEGVERLFVDDGKLCFDAADVQSPRMHLRLLRSMLRGRNGGVDIVGHRRLTFDVNEGLTANDVSSCETDDDDSPKYLRSYVCWEHTIGHHDPATDVFSLGLILASLACNINLSEPHEHHMFVEHRRNLFRINPKLHPVLARSIVLMTELDRHQRPQDLPALLTTLENYRDQDVDFETDLARDQSLPEQDRPGKRQIILSKLQERLFEINRRNRLLDFRSNLQTVNLTHASIPLSFDPARIRPSQVLTWGGKFSKAMLGQKPVSLNQFLNFREAVFLPGQLDRLRAEARRDETEYGFAQLRLILCFFRWADLKANPPERYESPLLLLKVNLAVKKGIHDRYTLTANSHTAEVNPVVRHLFRQLYDIELPMEVDLKDDGAVRFFTEFQELIRANDSSVELTLAQKPRVELIHTKAQRRLDQFRRRARRSGRGIRQFANLDYSYDALNYHPLGLRIFEQLIVPSKTQLEHIVASVPPRPSFLSPPADDSSHGNSDVVAEAEKSFYDLKSEVDDNPFNWEFDLCSVTLANLRYRKMSLVRDYSQLVADNTENGAFEQTFSITTQQKESVVESLPMEQRFHVVPCDPTQRLAISHARAGQSYIIQGPPGTGKSQTITNLIADYVMRGKRVLFVCEKRAAIDVVFHRLKQQGLDELSCLIHDSQADKKQFIHDLKTTFDAFHTAAGSSSGKSLRRRDDIVQKLSELLSPIDGFHQAMQSSPHGGVSVRQMLDRLIELADKQPTLIPAQWDQVPCFTDFSNHRDSLREFFERLQRIQPDGILARHPLCWLQDSLVEAQRPREIIDECVDFCLSARTDNDQEGDGSKETNGRLMRFLDAMNGTNLPADCGRTITQIERTFDCVERIRFLAEGDFLELLNPKSAGSKTFEKRKKKLKRSDKKIEKSRTKTIHWRTKLSSYDTTQALSQATQFEGSVLRFVKPSYWRLKKVMLESYDFSQHAIRPTWTHVLSQLDHEHECLADRYDVTADIVTEFEFDGDCDDFISNVDSCRALLKDADPSMSTLLAEFLEPSRDSDGAERVLRLLSLKKQWREIRVVLDRCLEDYSHASLEELLQSLSNIKDSAGGLPDYLYCLSAMKPLPDGLRSALRTLPLDLNSLEAAAAERSLRDFFRESPDVARYDGDMRTQRIEQLRTVCDDWMRANAAAVRESVRQRFQQHVQIASRSASQLTPDEKEFKKTFNRGLRELRHEFGKTMRYKSIRELASGDSGIVIRDLNPVWLMSPLSVSDTLPLGSAAFDVVIFDEASQITLEEAIPSLFRAEQAIVVGDEMQLPPTGFFSSKRQNDDEEFLVEEEDGEVVSYDLNSNSFLNHSSRNLATWMLGWHYRSRSESLISFSNHAFYRGQLLTVPEEKLNQCAFSPIYAISSEDGAKNANELLKRPVSFHFCENGVYNKRRNLFEAEYIAELVRQLLTDQPNFSIGIVAFSEAQQDQIDQALRRLAGNDSDFAELLEQEFDRQEDGQFMGLLIKNLENIQGDERDIIIMSVCYGPDPEGKVRMNFGPINQEGGEKRLNVAFSRARHFMALVSSINADAITNEHNDGANCLKSYLKYAEACSVGKTATVTSLLESLSGRSANVGSSDTDEDILSTDIEAALREHGFQVDRDVGFSHFRCDLAVYREDDSQYLLGILTDNSEWYLQSDSLERELQKPQLLADFGWTIEVVLASDWYADKESVIAKLVKALGRNTLDT